MGEYSADDLADSYLFLAIEPWHAGKLTAALEAIAESERIARAHRVKFEGAGLRREIQAEQRG